MGSLTTPINDSEVEHGCGTVIYEESHANASREETLIGCLTHLEEKSKFLSLWLPGQEVGVSIHKHKVQTVEHFHSLDA